MEQAIQIRPGSGDFPPPAFGAGADAEPIPGAASSLVLGGVLTIFIAIFGYRLILGDTPDWRSGILTVVKLGVVLVLATSWPAFRTLAYDVALKGPAELAGAVGGASGLPGAGGGLVARLQAIDDEMAELTVIGTGRPPNADLVAGPTAQPMTPAQQAQERRRLQDLASHARWDPAHDLSLLGSARTVFLSGTIAAFASVRLIAGLLLALGPLFAIFLLFSGTRGLFEGWVRGLAGAALGAVATAIVLGVELALIEPWLEKVPWLASRPPVFAAAQAVVMTPPITADQVLLLKSDNVASGAFPSLADLGITPTTLEAVLPTYLYPYRRGGQYADQEDREFAAI